LGWRLISATSPLDNHPTKANECQRGARFELAMSSIFFVVLGHPVGYTRTTQRSKYSASYQRYAAYKSAVVAAFLDQIPGDWGYPKPLTTTKDSRTEVSTMIYFKGNRHSDPSNVHKGIEDALFKNDKYCLGDFDFDYDPINPRVEVTIK
jgi:hypothetical protein